MATSPVDPAVAKAMSECMTMEGIFANPASQTYQLGWQASQLVENAAQQVAELVHCSPEELVWTSGATESDNLAILGVAESYQRNGKHLITMATEHKAILDPCRYLETQGFEVTYLKPSRDGLLDLDEFKAAIRPDTLLASIMLVNNETGVIQDIPQISEIARKHNILMHCDAAQATGRVPINLSQWPVDLMSLASHKSYGPKGIGALYVRQKPRVRLSSQIYGGGHQRGMRSGTLPTHQIVGMGKAFEIAQQRFNQDQQHIEKLSRKLCSPLNQLSGFYVNGANAPKIPGCVNFYFEGVEGESLMLSLHELALSSGSACNSANPDPSHVLLAMGLPRMSAYNSLRLSIGRFTSETDIDHSIVLITQAVQRLRSMSPIWDSVKNQLQTTTKTSL